MKEFEWKLAATAEKLQLTDIEDMSFNKIDYIIAQLFSRTVQRHETTKIQPNDGFAISSSIGADGHLLLRTPFPKGTAPITVRPVAMNAFF